MTSVPADSLALCLVRARAALKASTPPWLLPPLIDSYYAVRALLYRGDRVTCPVCAARSRAFIPFLARGGARFDGFICPRCSSHPRHRLLWLYLGARTHVFTAPLRILHLAPEHAIQSRLRRLPRLDYLSADLASPLAAVRTDVTALALAGDHFDLILANHVLEHIPDDRRAMGEILRVLAPGGTAILQVPLDTTNPHTVEDPSVTDPAERERRYGQYDHVRLYGRDYRDRLAAAGFAVTVDDFVRRLPAATVARHGLDPDEDIYLCRKPGTPRPDGALTVT